MGTKVQKTIGNNNLKMLNCYICKLNRCFTALNRFSRFSIPRQNDSAHHFYDLVAIFYNLEKITCKHRILALPLQQKSVKALTTEHCINNKKVKIMKVKFLALFAMVAVMSFTSCSSDGDIDKFVGPPYRTTVDRLYSYNDEVMLEKGCTRAGGGGGRLAKADIKGGCEGAKFGWNALKGASTKVKAASAATMGLIAGAAASYLAYKQSKEEAVTPTAKSATDFLRFGKMLVKNRGYEKNDKKATAPDNIARVSIDDSTDCGNIILPNEFEFIRPLGALHNEILVASNYEGNLPVTYSGQQVKLDIDLSVEEEEQIEQLIYSNEFETQYNEILSDIKVDKLGNVTFLTPFDENDRVDMALKAYLELFDSYPENVNDVLKIANDYIRIIDESEEFSFEEKEMVYCAIMISIYSPQLWDNFK